MKSKIIISFLHQQGLIIKCKIEKCKTEFLIILVNLTNKDKSTILSIFSLKNIFDYCVL